MNENIRDMLRNDLTSKLKKRARKFVRDSGVVRSAFELGYKEYCIAIKEQMEDFTVRVLAGEDVPIPGRDDIEPGACSVTSSIFPIMGVDGSEVNTLFFVLMLDGEHDEDIQVSYNWLHR